MNETACPICHAPRPENDVRRCYCRKCGALDYVAAEQPESNVAPLPWWYRPQEEQAA